MVENSTVPGAFHDSNVRSTSEIFGVLANRRRRYVLACLADATEAVALADLAQDVVARERGAPGTEVPREEVQSVHLSLYHVHVPKLADAGVVEYDQDRDLVQLSGSVDQTEFGLPVETDGGADQ